ncbi:hypothetical protein VTK56DRAFT_4978 [Thermocarpiscus australiensis]
MLTLLPSLQTELDDDALPPPDSVAKRIPPFHLHGEGNCGDHRHGIGDRNVTGQVTRPWLQLSKTEGKKQLNKRNWACSKCLTHATLNQLHDLPCGDRICRGCLEAAASKVTRNIENQNQLPKIQESLARIAQYKRCLLKNPDMDNRERNMLIRGQAHHKRTVLKLAGLSCCGTDMQLLRFMACMSPKTSRDLWLAYNWLNDPARCRRACGWPDCGAYVPVCCSYSLPWEPGRRFYCVSCKGNSMECRRTLPKAQTKFPCLPEGQPALTPAS